jgi:hypothetical protein
MTKNRAESAGRRIWLAAAFVVSVTWAPNLFGDPMPPPSPCAAASVAVYDAVGFQCTVGGYTLEDFTFSSSATGGATLLTDSQITVDPTGSDAGVTVEFSGSFADAVDQTETYIFQYELDPLLPRIGSATASTGPGDPVMLTGQYCGDGTLNPYVAGQPANCSGTATTGIFPANIMITGNDMSASASFPQVVTDLDSRLILTLDGPASVTSFGSTANIVPEPSTALFLAPGMLGFLFIRKRWMAKNR